LATIDALVLQRPFILILISLLVASPQAYSKVSRRWTWSHSWLQPKYHYQY